jgi:hypothetical protein
MRVVERLMDAAGANKGYRAAPDWRGEGACPYSVLKESRRLPDSSTCSRFHCFLQP